MGNKRRRDRGRPEDDRKPLRPAGGPPSTPDPLPPRLSVPLSLLAILAAYAWMLTWSDWFLYTYFTTHFQDNFRVLIAFYKLLGTIRSDVITANLRDMAWTCAIFTSAFALGRIILDSLRPDAVGDWGRDFGALAMGLGLFSLGLLFLGLAGLWVRPAMIAIVLAPLAMGSIRYGSGLVARVKTIDARNWFRNLTLWEVFGFMLLASYLMMNLMSALGPEYFYDSLVYHLAMPELYLLHQRIVPTPHMIYSGVPFATEMLYGLGLALGSETLAKLIHFGFGAATAAAIYGWCKRNVNGGAALLATLLFYSAPMVCFASSVATIELSLAFYLLVAALLIVEAAEREDSAQDAGLLLLSGTLAGLAFGTKYNAGLYVPALALPLVYRQIRAETFGAKTLIKQLAFFFGSAALVSSPWLIKNWLFYHNPTYPFLNDFFGGSAAADVAGLRRDAHARDIVLTFTTWTGFKDLIAGVWDPHGQRMDSYVGPALEIGLPWLFLARWKPPKHRGLLIVLAGLWLAWALHTTLSRFIMPAVPIYCILVASAPWLIELPRRLRFVVVGVFCYAMTISMARTFLMLSQPGAWKVAYGRAAKSEYLLHEHPSYNAPYYAGTKFINETLPKDATVLFIGEERGFYCERKFITASVFDVNPMSDSADSAADADALLEKLRQKGITHLLVNTGSEHYQLWLAGLGGENLRKYEALLTHKAKLIFNHKRDVPNDRSWIQVYELQDP